MRCSWSAKYICFSTSTNVTNFETDASQTMLESQTGIEMPSESQNECSLVTDESNTATDSTCEEFITMNYADNLGVDDCSSSSLLSPTEIYVSTPLVHKKNGSFK